jgi:chaperone required for assembly of F1-ATPase
VELKMPEQHQRHQVAELQAGCGGIETAVHRVPLFREVALEVLRGVVHEAAPRELSEEIRHGAKSYDMPQPLASVHQASRRLDV